ncbi:MAG: pyridoxal 5'-phosphate synthase glutaminase subunit PdxT, partial [Oscillospiraceae bacterium]
RIRDGMPVWGTCAGLILLAREIIGEPPHLGLMDITVRRNAFGRQSDSFAETVEIPAFGPSATPLVFIRAPWIESAGPEAEVLCTLHGHIVAARQQNMLVTSFHPELTDNLNVYRYFRMADCWNHSIPLPQRSLRKKRLFIQTQAAMRTWSISTSAWLFV